jgi:hypothetical protein
VSDRNVALDPSDRQAVNHSKTPGGAVPPIRGIEIVRSAALSSRFFHGPRPGRCLIFGDDREAWERRVARPLR